MAIIDLDKIIISHTVIGVNCPRCGGNLKILPQSRFKSAAVKIISFGLLSLKEYRCEGCGKEVIFLWKRNGPVN